MSDPNFPGQHGELVGTDRRPTKWWYDWFRKTNTAITTAQATADAAAESAAQVPEPVYPVIDGMAPIAVSGPDDHRTISLDPAALASVSGSRLGPPGRDGRPGRDAWPMPGPKGDKGDPGATGPAGGGSSAASGAHMLVNTRPPNAWPSPTQNLSGLTVGSGGYVYATRFYGDGSQLTNLPGGTGNVWAVVKKSADESRNTTTTPTPDSALQVTLQSGKTYHVRGKAFFSCSSATPGHKAGPTYSGTTSSIVNHRRLGAIGATGGTDQESTNTTTSFINTGLAGVAAGAATYEFDCVIVTTSSGTFSFDWAQNTSNGTNVTVLTGSYLEYLEF